MLGILEMNVGKYAMALLLKESVAEQTSIDRLLVDKQQLQGLWETN